MNSSTAKNSYKKLKEEIVSPSKAYITVNTKSPPKQHHTGDILARNAFYYNKPSTIPSQAGTVMPSTEVMVSGAISREEINSSFVEDETYKEEVVLEYPTTTPVTPE